jgi:hypothetical protein
MKVYFYDGDLLDAPPPNSIIDEFKRVECIDAAFGPSSVLATLSEYKEHPVENTSLLSNSILALSHEYGWNEAENHTDIYIYSEKADKYIRIDKLTDKEIRRAHNIGKMYIAGTFDI